MDLIEIRYVFRFNGLHEKVDIQLDAASLELVNKPGGNLPAWAHLDFHQCPHCPLDTDIHEFCPVAGCLVDVVERFDKILSYDEVDLEVITSERKVFQHTTAQRSLGSLLGILFPASGCPHTAFFKPMVRFHLPMATREETIFRATGMYLLAQYFLEKHGQNVDVDFDGLTHIYENLNILNIHMADRLRGATQTDSSINAIIMLDVFTHALPFVIEDQLEEIRNLFTPYFSDFYQSFNKNIT